jgi:ATP-dependent Lhr-like helicase
LNDFDHLHPSLQHHVVNSLGWKSLRPVQEQCIAPILDGENILVLAPTAGGKTEAAVIPLLSRILTEGWSGLSILYVCPIKALLNNLHPRLEHYCKLVGRRCDLWHGDTTDSIRRRIIANPPDILLTTPESLEVLLVHRHRKHPGLLTTVRAVVIDEMHAFAGDDRGWHLLSVLERVGSIAGRPLQRVGLSATVGNAPELLGWLTCGRGGSVIDASAVSGPEPDVQLDFVGSLENAAVVISMLHAGEKRLVFCDSRARVEQLGRMLRDLNVDTYVSHSSLSIDERRQAEAAFAGRSNCVIVATSTLELGIDVGNLDRVIQIDSPTTVASFLQRIGRTGRRPGTRRNCLFLATSEDALLQAAALIQL